MGLAGRKVKQRIGNDPRNLAWSENAAKFGHTYMAKLGWNPTLGLGANNDGRTTNIAVAQKLDQLGIGAGRGTGSNDKDAVAWKQQNEFERMLARLNTGETTPTPNDTGVVASLGFVEAVGGDAPPTFPPQVVADTHEPGIEGKKDTKNDKKKKRKHSEVEVSEGEVLAAVPAVIPPPRRFAHHRSRLLNSKNISGKSAAEIAEVLGVAPTPSSTPSTASPSVTPLGALTPISDEPSNITAATTSMGDYFKEKMKKLQNKHSWMKPGGDDEEMPNVTTIISEANSYDENPSIGLGVRDEAVLVASTSTTPYGTGLLLHRGPILNDTPGFKPTPAPNSSTPSSSRVSAEPSALDDAKQKGKEKKAKKSKLSTSIVASDMVESTPLASISDDSRSQLDIEGARQAGKQAKKKRKIEASAINIQISSEPMSAQATAKDEGALDEETLRQTRKAAKKEEQKRRKAEVSILEKA